MDTEKTWAYCPTCGHRQRFLRADVNHAFHAVMTVLTLGLWLISWAAVTFGHRFAPWRCKHCGSSAPDFTRAGRDGGTDEGGEGKTGG